MPSFSEMHDHEFMWAHDADQYREICIAYSSVVIAYIAAHNSASNRIFVRFEVPFRNIFSTRACT
jgi:hypothetical protein